MKCIEKYGRENFGVQQLPLFNLLTPEELDWQVCLSRLEGKRRLDTRVPKKFALDDVMVEGMGLKMPFGDGLRDAIWRCDRGMVLEMPSGNCW